MWDGTSTWFTYSVHNNWYHWLVMKLGFLDEIRSIRSTLEDSSILKCFFRFSLLMLCLCRKVRDLHMSSCARITKHKQQQQRSCILVQTRTQHKKRVPRAAEAISQVLFSFFIGIK